MTNSLFRWSKLLGGLVLALSSVHPWARADQAAGTPAALAETEVRQGVSNFLAKLQRGGEVRIGYLGGSITAQPGWRPKTLAWFQAQYPQTKLGEINAAIGGTGSDLGVFRLKHDVLDHKPDLLFVEFAVNDAGAAPEQIYRAMEGIVRQTWKHDPVTDICFVYTIAGNMLQTYQAGQEPRSVTAMEKMADHYGIPSINFGPEVARLEKAGQLLFKQAQPKTEAEKAAVAGKILFSPDAVHPYPDGGHDLYLQSVIRGFARLKGVGQPGPHVLSTPLVADNWEHAQMVPLSKVKLSAGWQRLDPATSNIARQFQSRLPELWKADKPGETIEFTFRGTYAAVYDLLAPDSGQVIVSVDGGPPQIRPRFDAYTTGSRLGSLKVAVDLPDRSHTVKLTIHPEQPDKVKILAQRNQTMDRPERFNGTAWYAGAILLVGEIE